MGKQPVKKKKSLHRCLEKCEGLFLRGEVVVKSLGFGIRQACLPITPGGLLSSLGRVTLLLLASVSSSMGVITPLGVWFCFKDFVRGWREGSAEGRVQVPAPIWWLTTNSNSSSCRSSALFRRPGEMYTRRLWISMWAEH